MTTHQTPHPSAAVTRETWRRMVEANNDSAATDPVDFVETTAPHYEPRGRHRWLWHYAIPIGELEPGVQAITSRTGTAVSERAAKWRIRQLVSRHFDEENGRDPHGPTLDWIRRTSLGLLLVVGLALLALSTGCSPSVLGTVTIGAAAIGMAATIAKGRRATARRS